MKVLLIGNYEPDDQFSMLAFSRVLERELPRLGCEVRVLVPPVRLLRLLRVPRSSRMWKWLGYIDKFILFIPALKRHARWADVVHVCDHSNGMYMPRLSHKPNLITCHDVIAIQAAQGMIEGWHVGRSGRLFQKLIGKGIGKADLVACVSHLTQRALLALRLAEPQKVDVVLNGLNDDFAPVAAETARELLGQLGLRSERPFLLHVGSDLPRKNRRNVLLTFAALHRRAAASGIASPMETLVFAGPALDSETAELAREHGVDGLVHNVTHVPHAHLRALYSSASALLFPSFQEGFGWPLIEAQACGCPVFASDLAPMNEIGGDGAVYVDPHDPEAMALAIEQAAPRLGEMRRLGLANAAGYTAETMTSHYLAAYRRVIEQHRSAHSTGTAGAVS